MNADFIVENHGTICLLIPQTEAAKEWIAEHIPTDSMRWNGAIVIEHRFIANVVTGIKGDGLEVSDGYQEVA